LAPILTSSSSEGFRERILHNKGIHDLLVLGRDLLRYQKVFVSGGKVPEEFMSSLEGGLPMAFIPTKPLASGGEFKRYSFEDAQLFEPRMADSLGEGGVLFVSPKEERLTMRLVVRDQSGALRALGVGGEQFKKLNVKAACDGLAYSLNHLAGDGFPFEDKRQDTLGNRALLLNALDRSDSGIIVPKVGVTETEGDYGEGLFRGIDGMRLFLEPKNKELVALGEAILTNQSLADVYGLLRNPDIVGKKLAAVFRKGIPVAVIPKPKVRARAEGGIDKEEYQAALSEAMAKATPIKSPDEPVPEGHALVTLDFAQACSRIVGQKGFELMVVSNPEKPGIPIPMTALEKTGKTHGFPPTAVVGGLANAMNWLAKQDEIKESKRHIELSNALMNVFAHLTRMKHFDESQ